MKTIESLVPGSSAWLQSRSASKAPAVMSASKYQTRSDLIKQMATGITKDVDANTQRLFDAGHASEASAREIAEDILCDGLSPVCGESDDGYLTASFDGLTFDGRIGYEHKLWNEKLAAAVRAGELPEEYKIQMDQQILVGGLDYVLFMVSDGTREKMVSMEYRSSNERALALLAAWRQFDIDLAAYQHVEAVPVATAAPIKDLPAIVVRVSGNLTIETNFSTWGVELKSFIDRLPERVPEKLTTDQEFADCKAAIAAFKKAEAELDAEEARVLSSVPDVDEMKRVKKLLRDMSSTTRLILEKRAVSRDQQVKIEIMQEGKTALAAHMNGLNKRLSTVQMPPIPADFAAAIKGKRNLASMRDAVAALLAQKKIEANEIADLIQINIGSLDETGDYAFLFADRAVLCLKAPDDLALVIKSRIADHKAAEAKREEETRQRIRAEEEARAAAKVKAEQAEEHALIDGLWRNARRIEGGSAEYIQKAITAFESMAPDWENDPRPNVAAAVAAARKEMQDKLSAAKTHAEQEEAGRAAALALANEESNRRQKEEAERQRKAGEEAAENIEVDRIAAAYNAAHPRMEPATHPAAPPTAAEIGGYTGAPDGTAAQLGKPVITIDGPFTSDIQIPKLDDGARIRLGEINAALGFTVTAEFLTTLGFIARQDKNARLYATSDFRAICSAIINHVAGAPDRMRAAA